MKTRPSQASNLQLPTEEKPTVRSHRKTPAARPLLGNGEDRDEMLRKTAYQLYEARSRGEGHALDDWLQAEAQLAGLRA